MSLSLRQEQSLFSYQFASFILWLYSEGYEVTDGEAWRPIEMQRIYFENGKSKTMDSQHGKRLARDLNIFKDGKLLTRKEELQVIGEKWESLDPKNRWGGNWKSFKDLPHFERKS